MRQGVDLRILDEGIKLPLIRIIYPDLDLPMRPNGDRTHLKIKIKRRLLYGREIHPLVLQGEKTGKKVSKVCICPFIASTQIVWHDASSSWP